MKLGKVLFIRGPQGSGKSTLAEQLIETPKSGYNYAAHLEADQYFFRPDGKFDFNGGLKKEAHEWCKSNALIYLESGCDVIIANTFIFTWELGSYAKFFRERGIEYQIVRCTGQFENEHGVSAKKVKRAKTHIEEMKNEIIYNGEDLDGLILDLRLPFLAPAHS